MASSGVSSRRRQSQPTTASRLPSNRERRPLLAVLAVLLIVGGAAAAGIMALRLADRTEYAYLGVELRRGQVVQQGDLRRVSLTMDDVSANRGVAEPEILTVDEAAGMIGMVSTGNYPAGTLATRAMFAKSDPFPEGYSKVGMVLTAEQAPAGLAIDDRVQIWSQDTQQTTSDLAGEGVVIDVSRVGGDGGVGSVSQGMHVTVLVPTADTAKVAAASANDTAVVSILPPEESGSSGGDGSGESGDNG